MRSRVGVVAAQEVLGDAEHAACAARGVIDGLDDVSLAQVRLRRQQQADHEPDDLAGREVLPGFLVGLLGADADQLLEHIAHLHVVHTLRRQVEVREPLDHLEQALPLGEAVDLGAEVEAGHDVSHVRRVRSDVRVEVHRDLVRVVEQPGEVKRGRVVERPLRRRREKLVAHVLGLLGVDPLSHQHIVLGVSEHAVETAQHRERQDHLAVLVALVGAAQQIADVPDEVRKLAVGLCVHSILRPRHCRTWAAMVRRRL